MSTTLGKCMTVKGPVDPNLLGVTLTHEHVSLDFSVAFTPPTSHKEKIQCDITLPNLGWIRQNQYSHRGNIEFYGSDVEKSIFEEFKEYSMNGGGCIVENTTHGIKRNLPLIKKLANDTDVHVVCGTGYYVAYSQTPETMKLTTENIEQLMVTEIVDGCVEDKSVRCGLVGEIGCSWPLHDFEKMNIKAAAAVQISTGCPVMFHPGRHPDAPEEIMRIYLEAGASASKATMGHLDRTIHSLDGLCEFAEMGSYLEYDLFGIETSYYQLDKSIDMPSDAERVRRIKHLTDSGFGEKILLSHDIHTKIRLGAFGGHGFSHIIENIVPLMLRRGLTQDQIDGFLIRNPSKWLTFTK